MSEQRKTQKASALEATHTESQGLIQRKCACGTHTVAGGSCESCRKEKTAGKLQRAAINREPVSEVPPLVHDVLHSSGQPLEAATRTLMESRFNYDFSRVRVHTDAKAARSAQAVNAHAYTVGNKVVFGSNQYSPHTSAGRSLLTHELTHVTQAGNTSANSSLEIGSAESAEERVAEQNETAVRQSTSGAVSNRMQLKRTGGTAGGFFFNIGRGIADFFTGSEPLYEKKDLQDYLKHLKDNNDIEDDFDSDNKARAVVRLWKAGNAEYDVTASIKILLVQEMQSGTTGNDDENAILDLLENSSNGDLRVMFGAGGIDVQALNDDFHGDEWKRLQAFYASRFDGKKGGLNPLLGNVLETGAPKAGAPKFPYNWPILKAKLHGPYTVPEIVADIKALSESEQQQALRDVGEERVRQQKVLTELVDKYSAEKDAAAKKLLEQQALVERDKRLRLDLILQPVFKDIALAETSATLSAKTKELTPTEKTKAREALKPELKKDVKGVTLPFQPKLPGEKEFYIDKVRKYMPDMIKKYYDSTVVGRGPEEHKKAYKLEEMEAIGNVSKKETDAVFGAYYDAAKHPPLTADKPAKKGKRATRGNIHDLWQDTEDNLKKMNFKQKQDMAKALIFYFFQSDSGVAALNRAHNASPEFTEDGKPITDDAKDLDKLATEFTKTREQVKKLNEIDRGWDASASPETKDINIQLFKPAGVDEQRDFLWDMFQTLIHEYIHTLVHPKYVEYATSKALGGSQSIQNNTLMEGVDSLLDEIVWANIEPRVNDPALREKVEGKDFAKLPPFAVKHPSRRRYATYAQAVQLVNVVGIRNLYAAYFMGETKKIGAD